MSSEWSKYLATGVPVPPGEKVPRRQNINDLTQEQLYLYLEGLKKFQHVDADKPLSYFQIAGIHGRPYTKWPKEEWNKDIPDNPIQASFGGFCTHSSILFLTWHRPYLALFESELYKHVQIVADEIAADHPQKETYVDFAKQFRIPYWDWAARNEQIFPKEALNLGARVAGPPLSSAATTTWDQNYNPLAAYRFDKNTPEEITWGQESTVRYPNPDPNNPNDNLISKLTEYYTNSSKKWRPPKEWDDGVPIFIPENNLTERTAWILQAYKTFPAMSNNLFRGGGTVGKSVEDRTNWGSLEDIHNAVHSLTGGIGGHMSDTQVAAFDPIFWLHHTNIDRLYDIWQALHENKDDEDTLVLPRTAGDGGYLTKKKKDVENIDTPLWPFRPDEKEWPKNKWYTSRSVGNTEDFGYTYPETEGFSYPATPAQKTKLLETIGNTYDSMAKYILQSKNGVRTAGKDLLTQAHIVKQIEAETIPATAASLEKLASNMPERKTLLEESLKPSKPFLRDLAPNNKYLEWITNIKTEKHTLGGRYTVHVFLGPADDGTDTALWPISPTHVGTFSPLGQPSTTGCGKCQADQRDRTQITGQIPLTIALAERYLAGIISDLGEESVKPYLTENLHWRVVKSDGSVLEDRSNVDGLKVLVVSNEVTIPEDEGRLPIYAPDVTLYPEITTNQQGGGRGGGTGLTAGDLV